jgi:CheY-like chemotaxis protein
MKPLDTAWIIDDDRLYTYLLSTQMKRINFSNTLLTFRHGLEALNYLRLKLHSPEDLPSVILLDLNMPVLDGWQFLDEFVKLEPIKPIPVYVVSSSIDVADHAEVLKYAAVSKFLIKPVDDADLLKIVNELSAD